MRNGNKARTASRGLKIKQKAVASLEGELLRRVRAQAGVSRVDLARQLALAPSTVGAYVDRLIEEGFLQEHQKAERDFGRPPTLLTLNPGGGRFIGVDFEAHNLLATLVDFSQQSLRQIHKPISPSESAEQVIRKIEDTIDQLMLERPKQVLGIGIGVPGIIDPKTQVAVHYSHIRGWTNIPLAERLTKRFKVDVFLENNIRSMALAELWFGHGRGLDDFVCLGIRTGIAAGIIVRRRVLHGKSNLAGEIGDWLSPVSIEPNGDAGQWRSHHLRALEQIASVPAIISAFQEASKNNHKTKRELPTLDDVIEAARQHNPAALGVLEKVARTLGWAVCQVDAFFNPQIIILSGPLVAFGDALMAPLRHAVEQFASKRHTEKPTVTFSTLGNFNGALGAAALALHEWKPKR